MDIAIETPAELPGRASIARRQAVVGDHESPYGYIKGAEAKRMATNSMPSLGRTRRARPFINIDQIDPKTGNYDEAKVMLGFDSADGRAPPTCRTTNKAGKAWAITPMHVDAFKAWIAKGDTRKALAYTKPAAPVQTADTLPRSPQPEPEAAGPNPSDKRTRKQERYPVRSITLANNRRCSSGQNEENQSRSRRDGLGIKCREGRYLQTKHSQI